MSEHDDIEEVRQGLPFGMVVNAVARDPSIPDKPLRLYLVLATYANSAGRAWPGVTRLAAEVGTSRRTIFRCLAWLEERELLARRAMANGRNAYVLRSLDRVVTPVSPGDGAVTGGVTVPSPPSEQTSEQTRETPPFPPSTARTKVNGKPVTDEEEQLAREILDALTASLRPARPYRFETHLAKIVGRIRAYPDLTLQDHRRVIERAVATPWWDEGTGTPRVIYGNDAVFESMVQQADAPIPEGPARTVTADQLRAIAAMNPRAGVLPS